MRILQIIDSLDAGGAERMAVNIANILAQPGVRSYLCSTREEGLLKAALNDDVSYLFLNKRSRFDFSAIFKLYRHIKRERISIIHAHSTSFFMATLMKLLRPSLKLVWHDHYGNSSFLNERKYRILNYCSHYFSIVLCVNSVLESWAKQNLKCKTVVYLPNFAIEDSKSEPQTQLKGVVGKRILCLANLRPQKDHHTLLDAFKIMHMQQPEWTLHCVGQDFDDYYSKSIYQHVKYLDLESSVFFYGSCPDSFHIIKQADIGVLSSKSEGLPLALLEYSLGKLPIVTTNVGDCSSVMPNVYSDFLVPAMQPEQLAQQLIVLITNEVKQELMGDVIYKKVICQFSAVAVKNKLLHLYSQL